MNRTGRETEIKLAIGDVPAIRHRLRRLGFRRRGPTQFEHNIVWDTEKRSLARADCLLRLRTVNDKGLLTWKGPRQSHHRYKIRSEWECELLKPRAAEKILRGLGYKPVFRYEKLRTVYVRTNDRRGEVLLDETPIGVYLELEGAAGWIRRIGRQLGFSPRDFITADYGELYRRWCRQRGRTPGNMSMKRKGRVLP